MGAIHEADSAEAAVGRLMAELLERAGTVVISHDEDGATVEAVADGRRACGSAPTLQGALEKATGQEVRLRCRQCGNHRPADEFPRSKDYKGGRKPACLACERPKWVERYRRHQRGRTPAA